MATRKTILAASFALLCIAGCGAATTAVPVSTPTTATPALSPAPGTYTAPQNVTLSDATPGASIYYSTNGSTPTTASTLYSTPIAISASTTLEAIAVASGNTNSAIATGAYTINIALPAAATPTFSPVPGTYTAAQLVALSDSTSGASIYYTTDGSTPTTASTLYTSAVPISASTTIKAFAVSSGCTNSSVTVGAYTINISLPVAATPTFSPAAGTYSSGQSVTLSDTTSGAAIYYTTDGSTPTTASAQYAGAISVTADTSIKAIAVATGYSQGPVATASYLIAGPSVSVVLSTNDQSQLMAQQSNVTFTTTTAGSNKIIVDEGQQYQTIEGFGAAFTDSAAYVLEKEAQPSALTATLSDLFTRNGNGIGLSFMRNPMGASDIARSLYSFDDMPSGQTDSNLTNFSIVHDQSYVLPLIQQAKALNPQMKVMANPWSPPGWMKSSGSTIGGTLLPAMYAPFANYFVKYIQAYQGAGVPIDYISLQNEPLYLPANYPGMGMDAPTQLTVLRDYILPALQTNNLSAKVLLYDHNWDKPSYPETVLTDPTVLASAQVAGTAWHGYGGTPGAQQSVQNLFPTKGTWQTEHSGGTWVTNQFSADFIEITQVLRNSAKAYVKWSLALDQTLGPNLSQIGLGGCNTCTPIVTVNNQTGAITKDVEYYTLGHYSKYVLPGAVRIYSSNLSGIVSVAFQNPDNSKALIAFNSTAAGISFQVQWGVQSLTYMLPALAAATFTWSGTQSGKSTMAAVSEIQGSSDSSQNGLETETTSDTTNGYDLGYITAGGYAVYKNVDFGSSVTQVSVRTASGGNGGTAQFHLDSQTGPLVATVTLPFTGGWQNWVTVTAPASGASGVHDLYLVFSGGGSTNSLSNLNWFQFQ
jgi:glucosylceramidase